MRLSQILFLIVLFLSSCRNEEFTADPAPTSTGNLEIAVSVCFLEQDPACEDRRPVRNAAIFIYENELDRENGEPILKKGFTGNSGTIGFSGLKPAVHFISVVSPYGTQESQVWIPVRATARHLVDYYHE
jgi:hypothetical protein